MRAGAAAGFFWRKPMLFLLIFCFTVLPVLELMLLIELGRAIGTWPTILLVLGTVAGAFSQKRRVYSLQRIEEPGAAAAGPGDDQRASSPGDP